MRRRGAVFALVMAIAFGIIGSAMAYVYLTQRTRGGSASATMNMVPVAVAANDLTFGTLLKVEHVNTVMYPKESVPVGAFSSPDSLVGQTTKVFVTTLEPILATKLSSMGGGLSIRIPMNMRATSMNVNVVSGVSGFVLPGDRVDVLVVIDRPGQVGNAMSRTILQNIEVLAAGQKTTNKGGDPVTVQSVTLIVDPEGAEKLALGLHEGKLHLVLRNPADQVISDVRTLSTNEVFADNRVVKTVPVARPAPTPSPKPVVVPVNKDRNKVTAIRGTKVEKTDPATLPKSTNTEGTE